MKRNILIILLFVAVQTFATDYTLCTSGTYGNNSGSSTARFSNGGACTINPYSITWTTNDKLIVPSGFVLTVVGNWDIDNNEDIAIEISGDVVFDGGKLDVGPNSTISLFGTSTITCTGGCGSSDQIRVGTNTYSSTEIDDINNSDRPTSVSESGVTPITLLNFDSRTSLDKIYLIWATSYEENFDYFSLQRSKSGKEYHEIAQIEGNGWSTDINNYSYTDYSPLNGKSYYRLQSFDFDGYTEIFDAIAVNYTGQNNSLNIYPNPASIDGFEFSLTDNPSEGNVAEIFTLQGTLVKTIHLKENAFSYKVSELNEKGTYLLKAKINESVIVKRFVIN